MAACPACLRNVSDTLQECPYCGVIFAKWKPRPTSSTALDYKKAINGLNGLRVGPFGAPAFSKEETLSKIQSIEKDFSSCESFEFEFQLGSAWEFYTFFFVRGEERKVYLERAVQHLERAHELAQGKKWDRQVYPKGEPAQFIGVCLGSILIREAQVRDLEKGLALLEGLYNATKGYSPALCTYAEGLYKRRSYQEAARVATAVHERARMDPAWRESVPPAPLQIAAKAYRAEAKRLKKDGNVRDALKAMQGLIQTGLATANDQRMLVRLNTQSQAS